jgi:hypothetical protein
MLLYLFGNYVRFYPAKIILVGARSCILEECDIF